MSSVCPIRPLIVAVAAAVLLAGCGGGSGAGGAGSSPTAPTATALAENGVADLPATEILAKAKTALTQASSVHIKGGGVSDGQQFALDMRYGTAGATGSLTINGQVIELLRVGSTAYLKGTEAFWRSSSRSTAVAELLKGRYLELPANRPDFAELTSFTDLRKDAAELVTPEGEITKGGRKTVYGVEAIALDSSKGGTLYVALRGEPYPLQAVSSAEAKSGDTGSLDFLDYGVPVTVTAPPADQVVDISKLGGG